MLTLAPQLGQMDEDPSICANIRGVARWHCHPGQPSSLSLPPLDIQCPRRFQANASCLNPSAALCQVDEEASIRANTTVLLGNIAKYLGEATCKRVLLNAFTRALKDSFPAAKIAGLRAMVATGQAGVRTCAHVERLLYLWAQVLHLTLDL